MSNTELSEFFSLVSKEKNENLEQLKNKIKNPKSDLSNLFKQLENAHKETTKVSEEISIEKILTEEDQNRLGVFSNLMNSFDSVKELPEEVKVVHDVELKEIEEPEEVIPEEVVKPNNIINDIVDALDEMGEKTEVKEEIDQISALRRDFNNFRNLIQRDIANQKMSGAGSGEVRIEFLDDVQSSTAKVDGKVLQYSSSDSKWVGATISSTPAADDIAAGDAAVSITTTSGNITIDAAANNTDIIFKGTDASSDITMLTLDGSEAGAASFNSTVTTTGLTIGSTAVTSTAAELNILDGATVVVGEINALDLGSTAVGTAIASKAVILDSNKDYTGIRNLTVAGDLVVSGTTKTVDTVTMEAENAVIFEGATADGNETTLTIVDPTADHTQYLINQTGYIPLLAASTTTAISSTPAELNLLDGSSANSVVNSKAVIYGSSGEVAGTLSTAAQANVTSLGTLTALTVDDVVINGATIGHGDDTNLMTVADGVLTVAGELDAATLDISGNADIDGTLEADAITVDGTTLAEYIADTAGAMVSSNTETGIAVTYQDGDNTIDFAVDAAQTAITSIYNSSLAIGYGSSHANINFGTDNQITFDIDGTGQIVLKDGILHPVTDSDVDLGKSDKYWKDAYIDTITTTGLITSGSNLVIADDGNIGSASDANAIAIASDGVVTMDQIPVFSAGINVSGGTIAGTLATVAQGNVTSLGTLTTLTVDNIIINGTNIGHTSDTNAIAIASNGVVTFSQNPVFPDGGVAIADLDIDGGTDINAALADADLLIVDDGAGGTNRKTTMARVKTYINATDEATAIAIALG